MGDPAVLAGVISAAPPRCGSVRVVAVDGGAAAGKSTLAAELARRSVGSLVLHTDDLLDGWAGQFGFAETLRASVLEPLAAGRPGRYRRYDWVAGRFADWRTVPVPRVLIVEGVSALHACAGYLAVGIFLDVPRPERERRWIERDGPLQPDWVRWLDAEDRFFAAHPCDPRAIVLRDGLPQVGPEPTGR